MIPRFREWPLLIRLGLGPAWRDQLPARTRAKLRAIHTVDRVCYRLVDTGHYTAATLVWRACGLW